MPTHTIARLTLACAVAGPLSALAADPAATADWTFSEAAATTLNLTANTGIGVAGAGSTWDVAIPGVATNGSGQLTVRNTGTGGSGTRTAYADFGPVPAAITSGTVSVYASFASWNLAGAGTGGNAGAAPNFSLALIEGNNFSTAQLSLRAGPGGVVVVGDSDGDGSDLVQTATFAASTSQALTVRLSVDLDALRYSLAFDTGSGYVVLGSAAVDSFTAGVNSLRMALSGDFTVGGQAGRGLVLDRVWVVQGPVSTVPEPAAAWLLLLGLGLGGLACVPSRRVRSNDPR
jgi:hypothetical protein